GGGGGGGGGGGEEEGPLRLVELLEGEVPAAGEAEPREGTDRPADARRLRRRPRGARARGQLAEELVDRPWRRAAALGRAGPQEHEQVVDLGRVQGAGPVVIELLEQGFGVESRGAELDERGVELGEVEGAVLVLV